MHKEHFFFLRWSHTNSSVDLAGSAAKDSKQERITPHHIQLGIRSDPELTKLLASVVAPPEPSFSLQSPESLLLPSLWSSSTGYPTPATDSKPQSFGFSDSFGTPSSTFGATSFGTAPSPFSASSSFGMSSPEASLSKLLNTANDIEREMNNLSIEGKQQLLEKLLFITKTLEKDCRKNYNDSDEDDNNNNDKNNNDDDDDDSDYRDAKKARKQALLKKKKDPAAPKRPFTGIFILCVTTLRQGGPHYTFETVP